jgi:hypothetical protein
MYKDYAYVWGKVLCLVGDMYVLDTDIVHWRREHGLMGSNAGQGVIVL